MSEQEMMKEFQQYFKSFKAEAENSRKNVRSVLKHQIKGPKKNESEVPSSPLAELLFYHPLLDDEINRFVPKRVIESLSLSSFNPVPAERRL
jgi:predicted Zn-dependent peptidase